MDNKRSIMTDQYKRIQGATLKILDKNYHVYKGVNTIGRNKNAIIDLKNLNVSQHHAQIIIVDDSQHFISDLNSSNGTYLQDTKLCPYKLYELPNDVELKFGDIAASYFKVGNMETTIHLEVETLNSTQNMSQNFYNTATQLMINESSLNEPRPNEMLQHTSNDLQDIHEAVTQVVIREEIPNTVNTETKTDNYSVVDIDIHEAPTQVVDFQHLSTSKSVNEFCVEPSTSCTKVVEQLEMDVHEMPTQVSYYPQELIKKQTDEKNNDLPTDIMGQQDRLLEKAADTTRKENVTNTAIEETTIEESVLKDRDEFADGNSNDSLDFLAVCTEKQDDEVSESSEIGLPRRRVVRKLSSSEDLTQTHTKKTVNSDSDTDLEDEITIPTAYVTNNSTKAIETDSDTDIENEIQKQSKLHAKTCNSDSETDIEDNLLPSSIVSQDVIKPKILNKKRVLDSDSETETEPDIPNCTVNASLNDTDCIPATQDALPNMLTCKNLKTSQSSGNSEVLSDESFKLGLTELMVESVEYKSIDNTGNGNNKIDGKNDTANDEKPENQIENSKSVSDGKDNGATEERNSSIQNQICSEELPENVGEDFYILPTEKIKSATEHIIIPETNLKNTVQDVHEYTNQTESLEFKEQDTRFKVPEKKFTFKKIQQNLDVTLSGISSNNERTATHQVNGLEDKTEDIYILPTQKLSEEQQETNLHGRNTSDLNMATNSLETNKDEEFYIAATQQMKVTSELENKISDDNISGPCLEKGKESVSAEPQKVVEDSCYFAATQPINTNLSKEKPVNDNNLLMEQTQDLGLENIELKEIDKKQDLEEHEKIVGTKRQGEIELKNPDTKRRKALSEQKKNTVVPKSFGIPQKQSELQRQQKNKVTDEEEEFKNKINDDITSGSCIEKDKEKYVSSAQQAVEDDDNYFAATQPINANLNKEVLLAQQTQDLGNVKIAHSSLNEENESDGESVEMKKQGDKNLIMKGKKAESETEASSEIADFVQKPVKIPQKQGKLQKQCKNKLTHEDDDFYIAPTQQMTSTITSSELKNTINLDIISSPSPEKDKEKDISNSPKEVVEDDEDYFAPTQPINTNLNNEKPINDDNNLLVQQIHDTGLKDIVSKKIDQLNLNSVIASDRKDVGIKRQGEIDLKHPNMKRRKQVTETSSQTAAFVQQPFKISQKQDELQMQLKNKLNHEEKHDQYETLSQIERFVKEPFVKQTKSSPKHRETTTRSKIEIFVTPQTSKENDSLLYKLEGTKEKTKLEHNQANSKQENLKDSAEKLLETDNSINNEKNISSDSGLDSMKVENSFALLEKKSTKTRKTRSTSNVPEIKVAVCRNRRSMTTAAAAETSAVQEKKLNSTRRSCRKTINTKDNKTEQTLENSKNKLNVGSKHKLEPTSTNRIFDISGHEEPAKKVKLNTTNKRGRQKQKTIPEEISSPSTSEETSSTKARSKTKSTRITNNNLNDSSGNSDDSALLTPSRRGRKSFQNQPIIFSPEKAKRKQKPKIVFTMLDSPLLESLIKQMGGSIVDTVELSTVLITGQVKRSQKLLTAIGLGKPICSPEWIHASKKANEFLDPWDFILLDKEAEAKWDFSLKESLTRASKEKLLANYSFQIMVNNAADVLKGAIEACGGKCLPRYPTKNVGFFIVVASPENRSKYLKIKKQHPQVSIVEPEAIFDGVLRQDLRLGRHLLT